MSLTVNPEPLNQTDFDRFLEVAADKPFEQKLLLVFAEKEQRSDVSGSVAETDFSVNPMMYTDKTLQQVADFTSLLADSLANGKPWDLLFVAALDASKFSPTLIQQRLETMVKLIQQGESERFLIFNAMGEITQLSRVGDQPETAVQ